MRDAPEVFDALGLTLDSLAEDVNRLRRAKRFQYFHNKGIVLDHREHEALEIQVKAVDMGLQVHRFCTKPVPELTPQEYLYRFLHPGPRDPGQG